VDSNGIVLAADDSVSLVATEVQQNLAPVASFVANASGLTVGFNAVSSTDPDNGPQPLSYTWDFGDGTGVTGISPSHTYAAAGSYTVILTVNDGEASDSTDQTVTVSATNGGVACEYIVDNEWSSGFVALITLTNNGNSAVNGWSVSWQYAPGTDRTSGWNANVTGSNPYTATNLPWNAVIQPGQSISFGMQGTKPVNGTADIPSVSGAVCQ
jgi:PKD repeat protein